jgi:hypothetical protein
LKERDYLKNISVDGMVISTHVLEKYDVRAWTGLIWIRIDTNGEVL